MHDGGRTSLTYVSSVNDIKGNSLEDHCFCFYRDGSGNIYLLLRYDGNLQTIYELTTYSSVPTIRAMRCYNGTWGDWTTI